MGEDGEINSQEAATVWQDNLDSSAPWILITYGATSASVLGILGFLQGRAATLRACVHYSPLEERLEELLFKSDPETSVP
jgi:ABC-type phosphate transport system auxiliary subunit